MRVTLADSPARLTGPVRMDVFGTCRLPDRGRRKAPKTVACGWQAWNPDPLMADRTARLPGSGSFYWPGAVRALAAARRILATDPRVTQIKIETISGRELARVWR